ncbi:MAG: Ldh family oxidoreductase [Roseovarius sp.]|nr:Ldh family oxidoreductase [Roseovarius sp.]
MERLVPEELLRSMVSGLLLDAGADRDCRVILSDLIVAAQIEGPASHGLAMLPRYLKALKSGWSNGAAEPTLHHMSLGRLHVNADNGYCQIGLARARKHLLKATEACGVAVLTVANAHHIGALRFDTAPFARAGYIAMAFVNSRAWVVPDGGTTPIFGTNPMSFACPRGAREPIVWDQASSVRAISDIRLVASQGGALREPSGLDENGEPTCVAREIVETGKLIPFGRHKGNAICLMVELLSAALGGGSMSFEVEEMEAAGASTIRPGYCMVLISPDTHDHEAFADRVDRLCRAIDQEGGGYIPGDRRFKRIEDAKARGVRVDPDLFAMLEARSGRNGFENGHDDMATRQEDCDDCRSRD